MPCWQERARTSPAPETSLAFSWVGTHDLKIVCFRPALRPLLSTASHSLARTCGRSRARFRDPREVSAARLAPQLAAFHLSLFLAFAPLRWAPRRSLRHAPDVAEFFEPRSMSAAGATAVRSAASHASLRSGPSDKLASALLRASRAFVRCTLRCASRKRLRLRLDFLRPLFSPHPHTRVLSRARARAHTFGGSAASLCSAA